MKQLNIGGKHLPSPIKLKLEHFSSTIEITEYCDKGGNGYLFFGRNTITGKYAAIKFYSWDGDHRFHAEPRLLTDIKSDNIISISHAEKIDDDWAFFITDYCQDGDLDRMISTTTTSIHDGLNIAHQILNGLAELHKHRLVHRDLKPGNIFIASSDRYVIGDFGSVRHIPESETSIPASGHTLLYTPPESLLHGRYGIDGDIYQVGVILYQLLGGLFPYEGEKWLDKPQLRQFELIRDQISRSIFIEDSIKCTIRKGKALRLNTLHQYIPANIRRLLKKITHINHYSRHQSVTSLMLDIIKAKKNSVDWCTQDTLITARGETSFRICRIKGHCKVEKKRRAGWRLDNSFTGQTLAELIPEIESRF